MRALPFGCTATREAVEEAEGDGSDGCPICGQWSEDHPPEADDD